MIQVTNTIALDDRESSLPPDLRIRLIAMAGRHGTTDSVLVVVSREKRAVSKEQRSEVKGSRSRRAEDSRLDCAEVAI
jgi:hypothetical protein